MSFDGLAEQELILERASRLCGGRIWNGIPDEAEIATDPVTGTILPYIVIWFGELFEIASAEHSIAGDEQQPASMSVTINCWGTSEKQAQEIAGAVRPLFRGWAGNDNMTPMIFRGSGSFANRDSTGLPSRFMRTVTMVTNLNQSFDPSIVVS